MTLTMAGSEREALSKKCLGLIELCVVGPATTRVSILRRPSQLMAKKMKPPGVAMCHPGRL
jgi:hypothetical protein